MDNSIENQLFLENLFLEAYNKGLNNISDFEAEIDKISDNIVRTVCKEVYLCGKYNCKHSKVSEEEKKRIHWVLVSPEDAVKFGIEEIKRLQRKKEKEKNSRIVQSFFW